MEARDVRRRHRRRRRRRRHRRRIATWTAAVAFAGREATYFLSDGILSRGAQQF